MSAITYNLAVEAGATFATAFQYLQADGVTPVVLTGYAARFQIRTSPTASGAPLIDLNPPTFDIPSATVTINLTAAQTTSLAAAAAAQATPLVYAVELTASGGEPVTRLVQGQVIVSQETVR